MESLLLLSLVSATLASSSIHIPLVRRSRPGILSPEYLAAQRDAVDSKYSRIGGKLQPRQNSAGVAMVNQDSDMAYYGFMSVGTPPTPYGVTLDTGSSDLWFQTEACVACKGAKLKLASSSLQQTGAPFSIRYASGTVGGVVATDNVEMGGFTIQNQVMGLVDQASGVLLSGNTAGLLGLAFQFISNTQSTPFWEALVTSGKWAEPLMSFWMTRYANVTTAREEEYGGEFRMGGTNSTLYTGDIEYADLPAITKSYWSIPLRRISVNGGPPIIITNLGVTSLAAIDTGTSLIGGPPDLVAEIYGQIPNSQRGTGNYERYWLYPCSQTVNITFSFGGRAWPIEAADFKLLTADPQLCVGTIFEASLGGLGNPDVPQWIIGDTFLKNVYSVFRYEPPSVGFAQLSAFALGARPQLQLPPSSVSPSGTTQSLPNGPGMTPSATSTIVAATLRNSQAITASRSNRSLFAVLLGIVTWVF